MLLLSYYIMVSAFFFSLLNFFLFLFFFFGLMVSCAGDFSRRSLIAITGKFYLFTEMYAGTIFTPSFACISPLCVS